jgi:hypothetical protein
MKLPYCAEDFSPADNPKSFSMDDFYTAQKKTGWRPAFVKRVLERMSVTEAAEFLNRLTRPTVGIVRVSKEDE